MCEGRATLALLTDTTDSPPAILLLTIDSRTFLASLLASYSSSSFSPEKLHQQVNKSF